MQKSWPPIHDWQIKTWKEELPWVPGWVFLFGDSGSTMLSVITTHVPSLLYFASITGISEATFPPRK